MTAYRPFPLSPRRETTSGFSPSPSGNEIPSTRVSFFSPPSRNRPFSEIRTGRYSRERETKVPFSW